MTVRLTYTTETTIEWDEDSDNTNAAIVAFWRLYDNGEPFDDEFTFVSEEIVRAVT